MTKSYRKALKADTAAIKRNTAALKTNMAALTTAAEVGENTLTPIGRHAWRQLPDQAAIDCIKEVLSQFVTLNNGSADFDYVARKIIAAAEVGLPTAQEVRGIMRDDWLHGPTIERCAQKTHDWLKHHGYEVEAIECAEAIRALKDKP